MGKYLNLFKSNGLKPRRFKFEQNKPDKPPRDPQSGSPSFKFEQNKPNKPPTDPRSGSPPGQNL